MEWDVWRRCSRLDLFLFNEGEYIYKIIYSPWFNAQQRHVTHDGRAATNTNAASSAQRHYQRTDTMISIPPVLRAAHVAVTSSGVTAV